MNALLACMLLNDSFIRYKHALSGIFCDQNPWNLLW